MNRLMFDSRPGPRAGDILRFREREEALRFLRGAVSDDSVMRHLRRWADGRGHAVTGERDIVERAAAALLTGALRARRVPVAPVGGPGTDDGTPARPSEVVSPTLFERDAPPPPDSSPAPQRQTAIDVAQQVKALLAAAKNGSPFCEQCERDG